MDDVYLVPFGSHADQSVGGPSLQAFDAEGESLFDDLEERCHLNSSYRELAGMTRHVDDLSVVLRALCRVLGDSLGINLEYHLCRVLHC